MFTFMSLFAVSRLLCLPRVWQSTVNTAPTGRCVCRRAKKKVTTHKLKSYSLEKWSVVVRFLQCREKKVWNISVHLFNQITVVLFNLDAHRHRGEFLEQVLQQSKLPVHTGAVAACICIHKHTCRQACTSHCVLCSYLFFGVLIRASGTHLRKTPPPVFPCKEASPNRAHQRESGCNNLLDLYADTLWYSARLTSSLGTWVCRNCQIALQMHF